MYKSALVCQSSVWLVELVGLFCGLDSGLCCRRALGPLVGLPTWPVCKRRRASFGDLGLRPVVGLSTSSAHASNNERALNVFGQAPVAWSAPVPLPPKTRPSDAWRARHPSGSGNCPDHGPPVELLVGPLVARTMPCVYVWVGGGGGAAFGKRGAPPRGGWRGGLSCCWGFGGAGAVLCGVLSALSLIAGLQRIELLRGGGRPRGRCETRCGNGAAEGGPIMVGAAKGHRGQAAAWASKAWRSGLRLRPFDKTLTASTGQRLRIEPAPARQWPSIEHTSNAHRTVLEQSSSDHRTSISRALIHSPTIPERALTARRTCIAHTSTNHRTIIVRSVSAH